MYLAEGATAKQRRSLDPDECLVRIRSSDNRRAIDTLAKRTRMRKRHKQRYHINTQQPRLVEVHSLPLDTGLLMSASTWIGLGFIILGGCVIQFGSK
jgi:hypothetical protein